MLLSVYIYVLVARVMVFNATFNNIAAKSWCFGRVSSSCFRSNF